MKYENYSQLNNLRCSSLKLDAALNGNDCLFCTFCLRRSLSVAFLPSQLNFEVLIQIFETN